MKIPAKYYKAAIKKPVAHTVGELKKLLAELPDDLAIEAGFGDPVELAVYNHGSDSEHLEIREHSRDEDED